MSKKPSCNLCGASLVEEDYVLICGGCARPREEWLKDQAEQLALAHQMGYAEGEAALRAENEELKAICRDKPEHSDLDAAAFQVNILTGALSRAEARIAELEAALEAADAMGIAVNDWLEEKVRRENYKMEVGNTPPVDFLERAKVLNAELSRTYADWVIAAAALKGDADDEG